MAGAFQGNAFQANAFQTSSIVSTRSLFLPVNCVMMGDQVYDRMDYHEGLPPGHGGLRPAKGGLWGKRN